ncbi:hypothetical protein BDZ45DRAFT_796088 [Acephala macrosclerotiorum]|nr:hypothetical protein BDZ45DRAFT_796088 [Acephala macrosclerotiorum]
MSTQNSEDFVMVILFFANMKSFVFAPGFLASATSVIAHATFQEFYVDEASTCARLPLSNSPMTSVTSADIVCNAGTKPITTICPVTAGRNITVEIHAQPGDRSCTNLAIGGNHYGPVIVYMGKGTDTFNDNCGKRSVEVPATLEPGNYLVRAEAIALHAASSTGGAQFYMTCFQVNVSGTGTVNPPGVAFLEHTRQSTRESSSTSIKPRISPTMWYLDQRSGQVSGREPIPDIQVEKQRTYMKQGLRA